VIGINGVRLRVVGVARPGFGGIESVPFDFWAPVTMADALDPARDFFGPKPGRGLRSIVRIKRGLSEEQATAAFSTTIRSVVADRGPAWQNASAALESHNGSIPLNAETLAASSRWRSRSVSFSSSRAPTSPTSCWREAWLGNAKSESGSPSALRAVG
jgi:hypothetical protein